MTTARRLLSGTLGRDIAQYPSSLTSGTNVDPVGGFQSCNSKSALRAWPRPPGCSSIRGLGQDADFRRQGAVHRTLVGDFHQPLALLGVERALHGDDPVDLVQHAIAGLAFPAILCV